MALLENIRVFVRVVELGSLSEAGRQMRLSAAVVSHRMQTLESHLEVRLLHRTTRNVLPTEEGLAFYEAHNPTDRPVAGTASARAGNWSVGRASAR